MKNIIIPIIAASLLFGCATGSAEPSHISVQEFESQYKLGHMQTMMDSEYLGQSDGRAYLRVRSMSLTDPKQWSEQIAYVELSELDKPFRDALPPKEYKKPSFIQWSTNDCSNPLMLPEQHYDVSQFGKGKYRIDSGLVSQGYFNNIYIIFQATNSLNPALVTDAHESAFTVKTQKVTWRSYKTVVEGRSVIRKEALMPNILPHHKQGNDSDYIWLRMDADSQEILDQLTPIAEGVIQDAA